jgi:hypothetical protein
VIETSSPLPTAGLQIAVAPQDPTVLKARYLSLQQECDFALWRAREANAELRRAYQAHARGEGPPPSEKELSEITALEAAAESRYRELRTFLREHFT